MGYCPLQAFQKLRTLAKLGIRNQSVSKQDQYCKAVYLLGPKGIEAWKSFTWEYNTKKKVQSKIFDKFEGSFQTSTMYWGL